MEKGKIRYLFDGAMGTYLSERYHTEVASCEQNNLLHPERVLAAHQAYVRAGATALKTNTFGANTGVQNASWETVREMIARGCALAKEAAGEEAAVFASVGPVSLGDEEAEWEEYKKILRAFLEQGVDRFLFETFHEPGILVRLADEVKRLSPDAYVIAECTVAADGYTTTGASAAEIEAALSAAPSVDAYGFNCTCGPLHLLQIVRRMRIGEKPVSVMPNAGYPALSGGRTVFENAPAYFAEQMEKIAESGAVILGGCCGTTPEHIRATAQRLGIGRGPVRAPVHKDDFSRITAPERSGFGKKKFAVELDPPADVAIDRFLEASKAVWEEGIDWVTIADCPVARARADSSMLAAHLKRAHGIDALPHLTCRDRNVNSLKALLIAFGIEGIDQVLAVTGDPIPAEERARIKGVFQFNSERLIALIRDLNREVLDACPLTVSAALNVNAPNFEAELERARRKEAAGASRFLTQPLFTEESFRNLERARAALGAELFGGIMPLVSYRNACFVNNEIAGINIPREIVEQYEGLSREEAARLGVLLSVRTGRQIADLVDGYYLITPFLRAGLVCEIIRGLRAAF